MVIQCKNLISLYILPDQRRVNLRYFDFDQNRLWGAMGGYEPIFIFLLFTFYPINDGWKSASCIYCSSIRPETEFNNGSVKWVTLVSNANISINGYTCIDIILA